MPSLEFKAFRGAAHKVKLLAFHPTQPWLVYADKGQTFSVIDWSTQQLLHESQVGYAEEVSSLDQALQRQAEKDPDYFGPPVQGGNAARGSAPGGIKDLCFMDMDTCFWQIARLQSLQHKVYSSASIPYLGKARRLKGHRWLVVACDTKILLQDLAGNTVHDIPRTLTDSKGPTCLAVMYICGRNLFTGEEAEAIKEETVVWPIIAAGTSSGIVYLLSVSNNVCYAKLVGGHKAGVTRLLTLGGEQLGAPDRLVSAAADGTVALWNPSAAIPGSAAKEVAPVATAKPHESEVVGMVLSKPSTAVSSSQDPTTIYLVTSGEDKRVAVLSLPTLSTTLARWKPLSKGSVDGLATAGPDAPLLAVSGERAAVWGVPGDGRQQDATPLIPLDNFLPVGTKKAAKVYTIACHPLLTHVVAVGANAGLGLLNFTRSGTVPAAVIPLALPSPGDLSSPRFSAASADQSLELLFASGSDLLKLTYRAERNLLATTAVLASREKVASLGVRGPSEVAVSSDGHHCSVVWSEVKEYGIYSSVGHGGWRQVQSGSGSSVAWASNSAAFAVLHLPQVRLPEARKAKTKKGKAREEENAAAAAVEAANMAVRAGGHVKIYGIDQGGVVTDRLSGPLDLRGETPYHLYGGAVLGVSTNKSIFRGSSRGHKMQFHSWRSGQAFGPELVAPTWLAWNPDVSAAALAYPDCLVICRAQPTFSPVATLPIQRAQAGTWQRNMLFVASLTELHAVFVAAHKERKSAFVETLKLASLEGGVVGQMASVGDSSAALPSEGMRCAGPVAVAGIREGMLWLIDARGVPFLIPLTHPGLRARIAAAQGDVAGAVAFAHQGLAKCHHDRLAEFIAAMVPGAGLEHALTLSGLGLHAELALARRSGKFRRALRCLQALAAGAGSTDAFLGLQGLPPWSNHLSEAYPLETPAALQDPNALLSIQHLIQHTAGMGRAPEDPVGAEVAPAEPRRSVLAFIAADNADEDTSDDSEAEEQAEALMGLAQAPEEAIDWDAPLTAGRPPAELAGEGGARSDGEEEGSGHTGSQAEPQQQKAEAEATREEQQRIAGLASEGLLLVDAALSFGHEDIAKAALRTLLRGAAGLPSQALLFLLVRCAQCGMTTEIQNFAARIVAVGTGADPEVAALAASLVQDSNLARTALQSSGLIPLAGLYSHSCRLSTRLEDINQWGSFLTAAAGNGVQFAVQPPN